MDSTRLCRLCLQTSEELVSVFESYQDSIIASILKQHFWFKEYKNDESSEYVCEICWTSTKAFHNFYMRVELIHKDSWNSVNLVEKESGDETVGVEATSYSDIIKQEAPLDLHFNIGKHEETEQPADIIKLKISKEDSFECNDDKSCNQSAINSSRGPVRNSIFFGNNWQALDDEYQPPAKKRIADGIGDIVTVNKSSTIDCEGSSDEDDFGASHQSSNTYPKTQSEKEQEAAQIRAFFDMKCEICNDVEFETLIEVRRHYRKIHKTVGYITCCDKRYYRRYQILNHILNHMHPDAFRCDQCDKVFKDKRALKRHIANHAPMSSRAFKCSLCSSSFVKALYLNIHVQNKHLSKREGTFTCDICNKPYASKLLLTHHIRYVHKTARTHICDICAAAFKTNLLLLSHIEQHSSTPRPKVQCNVCGARLKHEQSLQRHVRQLHDVQARQTQVVNCPICNKVSPNKRALKRHIRRVHGERSHQCTLCDKAFKTPTVLKEHLAGHTGEDLYSCPYCQKTFKSNANMYSHRKKMHLEEWTRDKQNRDINVEIPSKA